MSSRPTSPEEQLGALLQSTFRFYTQPSMIPNVQRYMDQGADPNAGIYDEGGRVGGTLSATYLAAKYARPLILEVMVKHLHSNKANVNHPCGVPPQTPLEIACIRTNVDCIRVLLENGANVNDTNKEGVSALMILAHNGSGVVALFQVAETQGMIIDINTVNASGKTALDMTTNKSVAAFLRTRGAVTSRRKPPKSASKTSCQCGM